METLQLSGKRLRRSLSFIAWMERVTTQRKYLNFSLFLAGLLQHTHEQIAFGFAWIRGAIEAEPGLSGCSRLCPRARLGHQHPELYQRWASWFLEPYQGVDQGRLLIMKSSTGRNSSG